MTSLAFEVHRNPRPLPAADRSNILANPAFGQQFTDHMVRIDWDRERGWYDARVLPFGSIELSPASSVLHYGQAIFEGIKAYRMPDGSIATFRPERNAQRMQDSARRMAMPELPVSDFLEALRVLVEVDRDWVPAAGGEAALYLRPLMFATEATLGVHPSASYTFLLMASPSGAYFQGGVNPVSVWLSEDYVRAAPGGTGAAKFAGNYAASLLAQAQASEKGCDQVVWLDAVERKYIEEMGGMNLMFVYGSEESPEGVTLVTPELSGSLLPGVTRDSLLHVARDLGYATEQRRISKEEWRRDAESGVMTETLACGTAAVVTPVGVVKSAQGEFTVGDNQPGPVTMRLRQRLTDIQRGVAQDTHGWRYGLVSAGE
ncbi:branched-chain amino acid aminotransferase [Corynebacterium sp. zg-331]|uniref:branched-chain amino acid aminotransferase n=1 Tax=unclassified Corynebacterium TaxID=2624378 RepID=UPI00128E445E|nr:MULTISPECIES: branched-chain amino acid aminotransferase [unclassified Corynebacterium]MBC3185186.1 branched-chain amino acid aminotransferase [Corynebacterium sp. zg-331]MPV51684.1 branched-chain amino acid aminotransferase [Corynebacterium sp. zg331]